MQLGLDHAQFNRKKNHALVHLFNLASWRDVTTWRDVLCWHIIMKCH
jgi:hypothetical protein